MRGTPGTIWTVYLATIHSSATSGSDAGKKEYSSDIFTAGILRRSIAVGCVFSQLSQPAEHQHGAPFVFHQFGAPSSEIFSSTVSLRKSSSMSAWRSERSMAKGKDLGKIRARHTLRTERHTYRG
jgi:hypothetical protein